MLHYIDPTLDIGFYDSAILIILDNIVNKYKMFGVMDLFASEIAFNKDSHTLLLKRLMRKLKICVTRKV